MAFSPGGRLLAIADGDGTVRLWDPVTGQPVGAPIQASNASNGVPGVAFSPHGDLLATARLLLKEAWIPERLGHFSQGLRSISRGLKVLQGVAGEDGELRLKTLVPATGLAVFCATFLLWATL